MFAKVTTTLTTTSALFICQSDVRDSCLCYPAGFLSESLLASRKKIEYIKALYLK